MTQFIKCLFAGSVLFSMAACATTASTLPDIGSSAELNANGYSKQVHYKKYRNLPAYLVEINKGQLTPEKLIVPANTKFRIIARNVGDVPAEFESNQLKQEKILYMDEEATVVILPLDPGQYDYYDDFTKGPTGTIIAK